VWSLRSLGLLFPTLPSVQAAHFKIHASLPPFALLTPTGDIILKHKGLAKDLVDYEWFVSQYADLSLKDHIEPHVWFW
jgi:hypothetical protein